MLRSTQRLTGTLSVKLREGWEPVQRSWLSSRPSDTWTWTQTCNVSSEELAEKPETKQTSTSWPLATRRKSMSTQQGTSSPSHGSAVLDSTPTVSAKVSCTLDQLKGLTVVPRSKLLMTWDNGEQSPRKLTTGPCALLKILDQTHGQTKRSSATASLSPSTSQVSALTREKTASVTDGWCLVLKQALKTQAKMLNLRKPISILSPWMMPTELPVSHAQLQASKMLTHFHRERNNASVTRRSNSSIKTASTRSRTTGELKSPNNRWKLFTKQPAKLSAKLKMMKLTPPQPPPKRLPNKTTTTPRMRELVLNALSRRLRQRPSRRKRRFNKIRLREKRSLFVNTKKWLRNRANPLLRNLSLRLLESKLNLRPTLLLRLSWSNKPRHWSKMPLNSTPTPKSKMKRSSKKTKLPLKTNRPRSERLKRRESQWKEKPLRNPRRKKTERS